MNTKPNTPASRNEAVKAFDAFLCRAWGETDMPSAELVSDWDGVRRFLIREWLGEEDEETLLQVKDDFTQHEEDMGNNGGPHAIEFEIGGVSIERVCGFAAPEAAIDAGGQEAAPIELRGIAETLANQDGFWHSCSGCQELNEGHDTGPYSAVLKCHLGTGCSECGGIGAVWDTTDYADMAAHSLASRPEAPPASASPATAEPAFWIDRRSATDVKETTLLYNVKIYDKFNGDPNQVPVYFSASPATVAQPVAYLHVWKKTGERHVRFEPLADTEFNRENWEESPLFAAQPCASQGCATDAQLMDVIQIVRNIFGGQCGSSDAACWADMNARARTSIRAALSTAKSVEHGATDGGTGE